MKVIWPSRQGVFALRIVESESTYRQQHLSSKKKKALVNNLQSRDSIRLGMAFRRRWHDWFGVLDVVEMAYTSKKVNILWTLRSLSGHTDEVVWKSRVEVVACLNLFNVPVAQRQPQGIDICHEVIYNAASH